MNHLTLCIHLEVLARTHERHKFQCMHIGIPIHTDKHTDICSSREKSLGRARWQLFINSFFFKSGKCSLFLKKQFFSFATARLSFKVTGPCRSHPRPEPASNFRLSRVRSIVGTLNQHGKRSDDFGCFSPEDLIEDSIGEPIEFGPKTTSYRHTVAPFKFATHDRRWTNR